MKNAALFLSLCALLLLMPISGRATGPEAARPLAAQQKGRIWTIALHRGWPDYAPNSSWATHEAFYAWLVKQKGAASSEIKAFKGIVHSFIEATYHHKEAAPAELATAMKTKLPEFLRDIGKPLAAPDATQLEQQLNEVVDSVESPSPPRSASAASSSDRVEPASAALPMKPPGEDEAGNSASPTPFILPKDAQDSNGFFWGLGGVILGLGIGFLLGRKSGGAKPRTHDSSAAVARAHPNDQPGKTDWTPRKKSTALPPAAIEQQEPRTTNSLEHSLATQPSVLTTQPMKKPIEEPTENAPTEPHPALPEERLEAIGHAAGEEVLFEVAAVAPAAATQLYGPAPDVPSIEARKLTPQSLPQMPICLRLGQPQAITGSFVLNPLAEQSRLIGNGIRELKTFFDFDLPLPDNFSFISTSRPGKMELRDGTWHLVEKAKIELK